ncbi:MAG: hypothetical protein AAGA54_12165 [Myxococcota bacterium]
MAKNHNCYAAAELLMFDEPERARSFVDIGCDGSDKAPMGCKTLKPALVAGIERTTFTVGSVTGLPDVAAGDTCHAWLWPADEGTCNARFACGDVVLYGDDGSVLPCSGGTAEERGVTRDDGDPAFAITPTTVKVRDDASGSMGAFELVATAA